jgi:hypothetical protein
MPKQGKKGNRPDKRPARAGYWATNQLEKNKVRNLMKHNKMTKEEATRHWRSARKGRMKR